MHKENPQAQHTADNGNATLGAVSGSVFILIDGHDLAFIIKDEKELEQWKSDGSIEKGDRLYKLYRADFVEQF